MEKIISIQGLTSPGVSFTDEFNKKFEMYCEFCKRHEDEEMEYAKMQEKMAEELKLTKSAVRVDIPFLYDNGFINEYRKNKIGKIKLGGLVTNLGKAYLDIWKLKEEYSGKADEVVMNEVSKILRLIIVLALIHRKQDGSEKNYLKILKFICDNGSIDEKEFYLMIKSDNEDELKRDIDLYRKGELSIVLESNNTVFGYNKRVLMQAGLIKNEGKRYYLNEENSELIKKLI